MGLLNEYTIEVINEFLTFYNQNRDNYASAITDLFVYDIEKDDASQLI